MKLAADRVLFRQLLFTAFCPLFEMMSRRILSTILLLFSLCGRPPLPAGEPQIDAQAFQLLQRHCFECHGPRKQESSLRLDVEETFSEPRIITEHNPPDSLLIQRISLASDDPERMPPSGARLTAAEIQLLTQWIRQGARIPEPQERIPHWSYRPLLSSPDASPSQLPIGTASTSVSSPIDQFVHSAMQEQKLEPSPREEPHRLLRRLHLDLIGLPPSPATITAFELDPSPSHYRRIVDSLLAHPQFGVRWARVWLDYARYADSHGFQRDDLREIWPYRDWVIDAFNSDMPYDQFSIEQLAGDLLPNATESQRIATGFHRCAPTNVEAGSLPEETRIEQVFDRVNTTGTIWLGTTLECSQCHDHKYDPISMEDYYRFFAYFNNTASEAELTNDAVPSSIAFRGPYIELADPVLDPQRKRLQNALAQAKAQLATKTSLLNETKSVWIAKLRERSSATAQAHVLKILRFESDGTTDTHEILDDGSVLLLGGDPPDKDAYRIQATTPLTDIRAIRLDALRHPSLPGNGPGRGDPVKTNFVLSEFSLHLGLANAASQDPATPLQNLQPVPIVRATADFSQQKYAVEKAFDGKLDTGWAIAPQFDREHHALFVFAEPLQLQPNQILLFSLSQQFGNGRTLGRFRLSALTGDLTQKPIAAELQNLLNKALENLSDSELAQLIKFQQQDDPEFRDLNQQILKLEKQIEAIKPVRSLVIQELSSPRPTHILERGDYQQLGELVSPAIPKYFQGKEENITDRLALARWLTSRDNPLVARVAVNRWWGELFGTGLVDTPEDFGLKGSLPSHPQLLDWLAAYYVEHNGSLKDLLRVIVLSETYCQCSRTSPAQLELDPTNRWLARGPRLRLDGETIRDQMLSISGTLNLKLHGPPIYPQQPSGLWTKVGGQVYNYEVSPTAEANRRSVYIIWKRASPYPSLINFDATSRLVCSVKRNRTSTPLQALTLLNDPVYVAAAENFADRIMAHSDTMTWDEQIDQAFMLSLSRRPNDSEREKIRSFFISSQESTSKSVAPNSAKRVRQAWVQVATVLLNLHETITKE
jgi:hypothetical protein